MAKSSLAVLIVGVAFCSGVDALHIDMAWKPSDKLYTSEVCFGKNRCFHPDDIQHNGSAEWLSYVHPSTFWDENDGSPIGDCCKCDFTGSCSTSRGQEHIYVGYIMQFMREEVRMHRTFLELGGVDGMSESNTNFLERCLHYRGVMVEGHPKYYGAVQDPRETKLRWNRPGLVSIGSAICDQRKTVRFKQANLLAEDDKAGFQVQCSPLGYYTDLLNISHIAFFSLDVEGNELTVLKSMNWSSVSIGTAVVEELPMRGGNMDQKNKEVREYLANQGMRFVFKHCWENSKICDAWFVNEHWVDAEALMQHLEIKPLDQDQSLGSQSSCTKGRVFRNKKLDNI